MLLYSSLLKVSFNFMLSYRHDGEKGKPHKYIKRQRCVMLDLFWCEKQYTFEIEGELNNEALQGMIFHLSTNAMKVLVDIISSNGDINMENHHPVEFIMAITELCFTHYITYASEDMFNLIVHTTPYEPEDDEEELEE